MNPLVLVFPGPRTTLPGELPVVVTGTEFTRGDLRGVVSKLRLVKVR